MRRIRKPRYTRHAALLIALLAIITFVVTGSWLPAIALMILALILALVGKNYWECTTCGSLTERV